MVSQSTKELFEKCAKEEESTRQRTQTTMERENKEREQTRLSGVGDKLGSRIEAAENKGDTQDVYRGVKALRSSSSHSNRYPTELLSTKSTTNLTETTKGSGEETSKNETA